MENQNKNGGLYVLIVILGILVLGLGGYIVYEKIQNNKISTPDQNEQIKDSTKSNDNSLVTKIDNSKDWVYNAEYKRNVKADSYTAFDKTYYANDIIVPYININSSYANSSNNDIKTIFDKAIEYYNNGVDDSIEYHYIKECNYKKYINDNTLSVLLTYDEEITASADYNPNYYTYNFDLKTGDKLTFEKAYAASGFNSNNINSKVEEAITKVMTEQLKDLKDPSKETGDGGYYPEGTNFDTYNNESIDNYKKSLNDGSLKFFLSENGKLNVIVKISIPAGRGLYNTIITVD